MGSISVNVVVQGLLTGLVYGLMALGLSVIFGVVRVVNFAHGELTVAAMYSAFLLFETLGLDPLLASIPIAAVFFGLGYLLQSLLINPFIGRPEHEQFILLVGLAILIVNGLLMIFGPDARPVSLAYGFDSYLVGPLILDKVRVFAAVAALAFACGLFAFFRYTRTGTAIRACADNLTGAAVVGLNVKRLYALTFGIGLACVGAAGALMATIADAAPGLASAYTLLAFTIVIIGGLGSMAGALLGGVLIGVSEALAGFFAAPSMKSMFSFGLLILVLYFAYVGQAWNLLMGFAGQLSLGHALYLGIGAYVAAALWIHFGVGPWLGVFAAIPIAALGGAFIGWLGWRFSIEGVYFALLTIAFAEFTRIGFDHWDFTGASAGFFLPIGGEAAAQWWNLGGGPLLFYYVALALATGATGLVAGLRRSALGYRWLAVREDAEAARALGINIFRARMAAMLISSSMTAVAGVFYAFYYRNLFPAQVFDIGRSIELILAPIIGGLGTVFGPIVGALILTPLGEALIAATQRLGLDAPGTKAVFYGLALMVIIWLRPNGVWPWLAGVLGIRSKGP